MTIMDELFSVAGKQALVTGGATGIGRMIATALVRGGAHVMIASRKGADCEAVAAEINALPDAAGKAEGFAGDVSSEAGVTALGDAVKSRTDKLHILFNNAGISWGEPLETFPYQAWAKVLNVNLTGMFTLTRDMLPLLRAAATPEDPARVVSLGSVMGSTPIGDGAYSYSASKAAVHHITRILAKELAHEHITVNAFAPGPFRSRMTAFATGTDEQAQKVGSGVPMGRVGTPEDIAGAALFLCGRGGSYVTGAVVPIDGGIHVETGHELFGE